MTLRCLLKRINQNVCMRDDQDLRALGGLDDETSQRGEEIGMQTRFRLVEDEQPRRAWCEERGDPQQITQRPVGELRSLQRA